VFRLLSNPSKSCSPEDDGIGAAEGCTGADDMPVSNCSEQYNHTYTANMNKIAQKNNLNI